MEPNRTETPRLSHPDGEIFGAHMAVDSIVDRLFSIPAGTAPNGGEALWEAGVARRMERILVERIRARIEGRGVQRDEPVSRA